MPSNSLTFDELGKLFDEMQSVANAGSSIAVAADFSGQARALEYGSVVGRRPWPQPGERTVLAVDPDSGGHVVVSAQAPQGFIRIHTHEFAAELNTQLRESAEWLDAAAAERHIAEATRRAAERALEIIRNAAPHGDGALLRSLHIE